jgi:hypothetical protein
VTGEGCSKRILVFGPGCLFHTRYVFSTVFELHA